jgi:hypothetical protein
VRYPASRGYVLYHYRQEAAAITVDYTSCADKATLRVLLPPGARAVRGLLNGSAVELRGESIEESQYAIAEVEGRGAHSQVLELAPR